MPMLSDKSGMQQARQLPMKRECVCTVRESGWSTRRMVVSSRNYRTARFGRWKRPCEQSMLKLFFSYSHRDEDIRNELEVHLALLKREGVITTWHDRRIVAGSELDPAISQELENAQIILLLISAHFLASDYCYEKEMKRALEKHDEGSAIVIPVIVQPCDWHPAPFGKLLATPTDGKAISLFVNQQEALTIVARAIRAAAKSLTAKSSTTASSPVVKPAPAGRLAGDRSSNLRIKRTFNDQERDDFLDASFEYIAGFFEQSSEELGRRNPQISVRFKRENQSGFGALIYENGKKIAQCSIWSGGQSFGSNGIYYSSSDSPARNSYNESVHVEDDGYMLHLKTIGMSLLVRNGQEPLSQQGAAELFWSIFIGPLQN